MKRKSVRSDQSAWDKPLVKGVLANLVNLTTDVSQSAIARIINMRSGSMVGRVSRYGTFLDDSSLRITVALRLGAKVEERHACKSCDKIAETEGQNGLQKQCGSPESP